MAPAQIARRGYLIPVVGTTPDLYLRSNGYRTFLAWALCDLFVLIQKVVEVAHLRIIDDELWDAMQARKKLYGGVRLHHRRRPKHMFSGLVRCSCCGASYTVKNGDQLACAANREKGACTNNRTIRVAELEKRAFEGIQQRLLAPDAIAGFLAEYHAEQKRLNAINRQQRLLAPDAIAGFLAEYHAEQKRLNAINRQRRGDTEKRLAGIDRQITNIVDAIADGLATASMKSKLLDLETEKEALGREVQAMAVAQNIVEFHPSAVEAIGGRSPSYRPRCKPTSSSATQQQPLSALWLQRSRSFQR
ncbi:MAG: zinc ribbon domain-containing protein [Rhizobiaceae bacterium]